MKYLMTALFIFSGMVLTAQEVSTVHKNSIGLSIDHFGLHVDYRRQLKENVELRAMTNLDRLLGGYKSSLSVGVGISIYDGRLKSERAILKNIHVYGAIDLEYEHQYLENFALENYQQLQLHYSLGIDYSVTNRLSAFAETKLLSYRIGDNGREGLTSYLPSKSNWLTGSTLGVRYRF